MSNPNRLKIGDLIEFETGMGYSHWGVFIGKTTMINLLWNMYIKDKTTLNHGFFVLLCFFFWWGIWVRVDRPKSNMPMLHNLKESTVIISGHLSLSSYPALSQKWLPLVICNSPVITYGHRSHSSSKQHIFIINTFYVNRFLPFWMYPFGFFKYIFSTNCHTPPWNHISIMLYI